ncbi:MAG: Aspartyl/glutamyl-tRNA(Asn/Gln) amidotransferase subunit B [Candidatus Woesebacteria bacterium GW2011_GWB1_38_5]|uniref:Aspartyl/glutamyl-tRNA(Asn/Gln) amidotransferase subunit B n=4 Tax=Candidatus Woeseibacteriota TaxID=1752722 RepID=A0A0G0KYR6_9BACT|nr:MAG: Aspartyl/glutamyl-tRNA(Asn/Gln) amidotransferase subunit B [Candidatus Woesebacteria bacterium GW2011_GWD1_38_10]KKQ56670.1 MAG: glutamyl-tRNA(Gln) amidotransferase, B subunit, aspartyl-tRNA(Asn)/glutamyl-tRNA (Gln) amidotransferase subunit B [Candidatus Woesebacteria bacterium GW2011_GWC1_38_13]KKQ75429.1 MAG: Aspartyl/glutamyl-tRNA(Asn/Gln) amidotransferase subunit B [Candidatus Woesebacteria bacterium GW2011_GWB1_38_5]KKQ84813.1 MAG: Aspartyl/glutamyl-tRNA(Asn/Gln) amidotransferase su
MKKYNYVPVIGLEVHIELSTKRKMFCDCSSEHFQIKPNTNVCPICLGLPGALPYPNKEAVKKCIKFGISFNCMINKFSKFDRKHYFYPDLSKGYQISQYDIPFCEGGHWKSSVNSVFRIKRIHLEEDTGKIQHRKIGSEYFSLIDFNRSGVPLMELVTEPDFSNINDVLDFVKDVQLASRYLEVSNADMEKGSMRLEANISLRKEETGKRDQMKRLPDYKVELKNINSFRFLRSALEAEIKRQTDILKMGDKVIQETRGYNEKTHQTYSQRSKEEAKDYRYFPEPDIPPILHQSKEIDIIKTDIPEMPWMKRQRYKKDIGLKDEYTEIFLKDRKRSAYFEQILLLNKNSGLDLSYIADQIVNKNLDLKYQSPQKLLNALSVEKNKTYASSKEIKNAADSVLKENTKAIEDLKNGKIQILGYLIGSIQKKLNGKGNINEIRRYIENALMEN